MKTLFASFLISLFATLVLNAQDVPTNVVSCTVFDSVTFNGATIAQIENTEGELEAIKRSWESQALFKIIWVE